MSKKVISQEMLAAARAASFNPSQWRPTGEECSLEDLWEVSAPGAFEQIKGCEVVITTFADGSQKKRLKVTFESGDSTELKLSDYTTLKEGDTPDASTIKAVMLKKMGEEPIMRFDVEAEA